MTKEDFIVEIKKIGLNESYFSFNEGLKPDTYILENIDGLWRTSYYDEKGNETLISLKREESESLIYLLDELNEDLKLMGKIRYS